MANPQKENGHTAIANELLEIMAKTYFSSYEIQIIFAIFRKTYGWNKKEDWITNTQLAELTGIPKSHVSRTIKKLLERKMIVKNGKKIGFEKDYEKWQKLPKQVTSKNGKKLPIQVSKVTQTGNKKLPKQVSTKEKKETIQKTKSVSFLNTFKEFKKIRKQNGKKMTEYAEYLMLRKLDRMTADENEQIRILEQSIEKVWQDVYPLKDHPQDSNQPDHKFVDLRKEMGL